MKEVSDIKEGDKLYVPNKQKAQYGDCVTGGLATIATIRHLSDGSYVIMEETGKIQWHLETLLKNQEALEKEFKGFDARLYEEDFERDNLIW